VAVLPLDRDATAPGAVRALRSLLPGVLVGAGSTRYFTELNRNRAPAAEGDALTFPTCPTVHQVDETTIAENLAAFPWIVETARSFAGNQPLSLSPVGLRPPPSPPPRFGAEEMSGIPRYVDVRQASLFAAGWAACHLGRVARAGFARATYFQATGWRGFMYGETGARLPAAFPAQPGEVYPLYHVFADVAELPDAQVVGTRSSNPIAVEGLALRQGGRTRVLLANLTGEPQTVRLPAALDGGSLRRLDASNVAQASAAPEEFRDAPAPERAARMLVLGAHALARIDVGG
jgi:hypothetical protein